MAVDQPPIQEVTADQVGRFPQVWVRWLQSVSDTVSGIINGTISILLNRNYTSVSATYTVLNADYIVEATANTFTITLPTAVGIRGRAFIIHNSGAGVITVDGDGSETINGLSMDTLSQNDSAQYFSMGTNWIIL